MEELWNFLIKLYHKIVAFNISYTRKIYWNISILLLHVFTHSLEKYYTGL